jgi:hypothetical protein
VEDQEVKRTYQGSCHCGAVRFEADIDLAQGTIRCNCSICFKSRAWMAGVPADALRLLSGEQSLREYQFAKRAVHHLFCATCGVRPFSWGSDGNGNKVYAVRVTCLDDMDPQALIDAPIQYFDMLHDNSKSAPAETRHL